MPPLILFDDGLGKLSPLDDLRASFEIRTGALTSAQRLCRQTGNDAIAACFVAPSIADLVAQRHPCVNQLPEEGQVFIALNGRLTSLEIPLPENLNSVVLDGDGHVIAARMDREHTEAFVQSGYNPDGLSSTSDNASLIRRPWDVLIQAARNLEQDLQEMTHLHPTPPMPQRLISIEGKQPVRLGRDVHLGPNIVFDTTQGPIVIDDGAEIQPMSVLSGPVYIGEGSTVKSMSIIRSHTILGPSCKVGGELSATILQGLSNKTHEGFVGNSYIGEWVNLGAGTTTSNLKNTYGPIRMQTDPHGELEETGLTHCGSIIGDHVKTAIRTQLQTGTCLHLGAMIALSVAPDKCVAPFAFVTDRAQETYDLTKFLAVAESVMARRDHPLTDALAGRISELHKQ